MSDGGGFVAGLGEKGERLDVALARRLGTSRSQVQRLIEAGAVLVDGKPRRKDHLLHPGEEVLWTAAPHPEAAVPLQPEELPVTVVYEDEALLVVDKPAGVVVHPAPGHQTGTLVQALLSHGIGGGHGARPGIVHRLDRDTSGLLVVARTDAVYQKLVTFMAARRIERTYAALVVGRLRQDEGTIDAPIGRHVRDRKRMSLHTPAPRRAVTHFSVVRRYVAYSLLDVRLETGRTHQIRVHFAAVGNPVAGDVVYGRRTRPAGLQRQFLHARLLALPHPLDEERRLVFEAPLPPDLSSFLASLEPAAQPP
jgi:23S rRNA pseudouridine1911/1915/1917 synthase